MGEALIEMFHQKAPRVRFREGFGMTEASGAITFGRKNQSLVGSSGQLLPNMRSVEIFLKLPILQNYQIWKGSLKF